MYFFPSGQIYTDSHVTAPTHGVMLSDEQAAGNISVMQIGIHGGGFLAHFLACFPSL